ncbi:MAG: hypothetical protein QG655_3813 [Actinomycetota bacterium]|nr:hypothetical protein [Actinomycetota bacterium]
MDSVLATLRGNKLALYGAAGFTGGAVGAVVAEFFSGPEFADSRTSSIMWSALHEAALAAILAATLFAAAEWHQRREITPPKLLRILLFGALAGLVSGAAGQALYTLADPGYFKYYVVRIASWALSGLLLGAILSRRVPNLGLTRGAIAGAAGGAVGCVGALITWNVLPESAEFVGRIIGFGLLGLALGLAIHIVETMVREASVEVEWAPNETSRVSLGATPVTVGGGEDHIFIRGLPHHVSSIVFTNGQIEHIETANGKRTPLQDGSRLRIGGKYMVVHASK